tara:strand:+ start:155 stop:490 length:336 start_codon:yes stop_codon:yes gene_type:complete
MTKNTTQPMQQEDDVFDCLQDQTLFGKYKVGEKIGSGSQGSVYDLLDLEKPSRKMAIKFSMNTEKQNEEIKVLKTIRKVYKINNEKGASYPVPQVISNGVFEVSVGDIENA